LKNSLDTAHEEGYEEGFVEGIEEGRKEGIEEGRKEGIEEGRKEGIEEGRKEIIINLHNSGMDIENITKLTKIDIETVRIILSNAK
jgi:flagellar biosynthesis/type III secretory pathway protein FliH